MKRILVGSSLLIMIAASAFAAGKGPEIQIVDGKVSIQAEAVTLTRFLHLLDEATGMTSKVSDPQMGNQKISVRLEGLELNAAIRKSFQGQPWNYVITEGKGVTILDRATAASATTAATTSSPIQPQMDFRNDNPPPPVPTSSAFGQPTPLPIPGNGNGAPQPPGALILPAAQGGTTAPAPLFQPIGGTLGAPLPGAQPTR